MNLLKNVKGSIIPQELWKRALLISLAIISVFIITLGSISLAKMIGIDPNEVSGSNFVPSPLKIFLAIFCFWGLQLLVIFLFIRFIHKNSLMSFGFNKSVFKNLFIGFGIGLLITGLAYFGAQFLAYENVTIGWSVPEGVSFWHILPFYFYFLIHITVNSLTEEVLFRCYPIELFRSHPKLIVWVILGVSVLFAAPHFVLGGFNWPWLISLLGYAFIFSYVYFYWEKSIWLIIGIHNAANFIPFSLSGNWKMGGLFEFTEMNATDNSTLIMSICFIIVYAVSLFFVIYFGRKKLRKF